MTNIPINYVNKLDTQYNNLIEDISETVNNFNNALTWFIYKNYKRNKSKPENNTPPHESKNKHTDSTPKKKSNTRQNESKATILFIDDFIADKQNNNNKSQTKINNNLSGNIEKDLSGNDLSGNIEKDVSGNDISGNIEKDVSCNEENDEHDENNENEENDENPNINIKSDKKGKTSGKTSGKPKKSANLELYNIPKLIFPTKRKIIKKFYKKLIVRLHPDKRRRKSNNSKLFQKYYEECKEYMEMNCLYKLWMLSKKMKLKIKITDNIRKAFIKEINILKKYNETLESSFIYKWSNETLPLEKNKYILEYIKTNVIYN